MKAIGLLRYDVEDYLTPQSHEALGFIVDAMRHVGIEGSYGVVGKKALALAQAGHHLVLDALRREPALGFHSWSHSEHPTIAEELQHLTYRAGIKAFVEREQVGVGMVADAIRPPIYFTQPGANWVPAAVEALPQLGIDIFFSDAWNSYVVPLDEPVWLGPVLHLSPPVLTPRPFLLKFPDNFQEATDVIDKAVAQFSGGKMFMVMAHPTELVSTKFWDAVNFAHGATVEVLRPAPVRNKKEQRHAQERFRDYLSALANHPGIEWLNVIQVRQRVRPLGARRVPLQRWKEVLRNGLGPVRIDAVSLSAAQQVYLLALAVDEASADEMTIPSVLPPEDWEPSAPTANQHNTAPARVVRQASHWLRHEIEKSGRLPRTVPGERDSWPIEVYAGYARALWEDPHALAVTAWPLTLDFLGFIQEPDQLHWDWPIFPHAFRPLRLWQQARSIAWSLAWVEWQ